MRARLVLTLLCCAAPARAHGAGAASLQDPFGAAAWAFGLLLFSTGLFTLIRRGFRDRARAGAFLTGWAVLALSLGALPRGESLSAHMIAHLALMVAAAPLFVLSRPLGLIMWSWPARLKRGAAAGPARVLRGAGGATALGVIAAGVTHAVVVLSWHAPVLFKAALRSDIAHGLQHSLLLGTAAWFWWTILFASRTARGLAIMSLFLTSLYGGALGLLLLSASKCLYRSEPLLCDAGALDDQRLAGAIMWTIGAAIYGGAAVGLAAAWLRHSLQAGPASGRDAM
jgi:putative membrane protein